MARKTTHWTFENTSEMTSTGAPQGAMEGDFATIRNTTSMFIFSGGIWNSVGGGAGGRLVFNPSANVGTPPVYVYAPAADELFLFGDFSPLGTELDVNLPPISSLSPGQLIGIVMPVGNPNSDIRLFPGDPGDDVVAPDFSSSGGAGVPLNIISGTFQPGARMVWEAVPAGTNLPNPSWVPRWDLGSLAQTSPWDQVLAAGNASLGNNPVLTEGDKFYTADFSEPGGLRIQTLRGGRSGLFTPGAPGVELLPPSVNFTPGNFLHAVARAVGVIRGDASLGMTYFVLEQELTQAGVVTTTVGRGAAAAPVGTNGRPDFVVNSGLGTISLSFYAANPGVDYYIGAQIDVAIIENPSP